MQIVFLSAAQPLPSLEPSLKFTDISLRRLSSLDSSASTIKQALECGEVACALENGILAGLLSFRSEEVNRASILFFGVSATSRLDKIILPLLSRVVARIRARGITELRLSIDSEAFAADPEAILLLTQAGFYLEGPGRFRNFVSFPTDPLGIMPTPLEPRPALAAALGLQIDLRVKRDDLYPLAGGGIKARKIEFILPEAVANEHDVIVTNGGPQSNHARATAIECARLGIQCHLVVVLDPKRLYPDAGNILLMKMSGATIEYAAKEQLAERMDRAMDAYAAKGHNPLYLWGGGHCLAGTRAFVEAAREAQFQSADWIPDFVVIASGTGTTHAGLAIGYAGTATRVIGISVARHIAAGRAVVEHCVQDYRSVDSQFPQLEIEFLDNWVNGGYEEASPALLGLIKESARHGFLLDPTYSGKGWQGLVELVRSGAIPKGSRVLFWHSGGLMNLQASPFSGPPIRLNA